MKKQKNEIKMALFVIIVLLLQLISPALFNVKAQGADNPLSINKVASVPSVKTGEQFHYTISYSVNDLENDYENVIIKDILPAGMDFVSVARNNETKDINYDTATRTLIIKLVNSGDTTLKAGTTGSLQINVRIPNGSVADGAQFKNKATIEAKNVSPVESNEVSVSTYGSNSYWKVTKSQIIPSINPAAGSEVTYLVGLIEDNTNPYGHLNLTNVILKDELPDGAVYVPQLQSDGSSYDESTNTVTWNIGNLNVGDTPTRRITVMYPSDRFNVGQTVVNKALAAGKLPSGNDINIPEADVNTTFAVPVSPDPGDIGFQKTSKFAYRNIAQDQCFYINNIKNPSNKSLDNFMVEDDNLPVQLNYTKIDLPQLNLAHDYKFSYKTHLNGTWTTYDITSGDKNNKYISISNLAIDPSDWITGIQFDFGTVPAGFDAGIIAVEGTVISPDKDGKEVIHQQIISNQATLKYVDGSEEKSLDSTAQFSINKSKPWLYVSKTHDDSKYYIPGDAVDFTIKIQNKADATGPYKNPIIYDLLPQRFDYTDGSWKFTGTNMPSVQPNFQVVTTNFNGTGRTLLKWYWTDALNYQIEVGQDIQLQYQSTIEKYTPATITGSREYKNEVYITTDEDPDAGFWWDAQNNSWDNKDTIKDVNNFDGDPAKEEYLVKAERSVYINNVASVVVTKWNKGELDSDYNKFPASGSTIAGGTADYKLDIYNDGNDWVKKVQILDILPYIGDTAVLTSQERKSEWRPNLIKQLDYGNLSLSADGIGANVDVYYSSTNDKTYANIDYNKSDTNYWIKNVLPEGYDITGVKSIYFDITNIAGDKGLEPGKTITLTWKMRAPVGVDIGKIAWNSVAVKLTTAEGVALNPTEPLKVGFKVDQNENPSTNAEIGDYVWYDSNGDGIQNDGYDAQKAGINNIKAILYDESGNKVDETLTANDQNGKPGYYLFPNLAPGNYHVEFEIPDYYDVTQYHAQKDGAPLTAQDSDGKAISESRISSTDTITLGSGEKNHDIDLGLVHVSSNSTAQMTVNKKAISVISKPTVNPGINPVNKGEGILYQMEIKNTGSVPLHNVKIQDVMDRNQTGFAFTKAGFDSSNLLAIANNIHVLSFNSGKEQPYIIMDEIDAGQTLYVQGQYTVQSADVDGTSLDNTISVWSNETNDDGNTEPFTAETKVNIADISISKISDVTYVEPGVEGKDTITYTITVKNNGNVALSNILVSDNKIDTFTNLDGTNLTSPSKGKVNIGVLNPGESVDIKGTYKVPASVLPNKVTNTATATNPDIRYTVSASKSVDTKALSVTKIATDSDKIVSVGDTITYTITVTNNGSAPLSNVKILEDTLTSSKGAQDLKGSITGSIPGTLPKGQNVKLTLKYPVTLEDIADLNTSKIVNTVKVKSDDTTPVKEATETIDIAQVKVQKTEISHGPYKVGDNISYEIKVTNVGTINLSNIAVKDNIFNKNSGTDFNTIDSYAIDSLPIGGMDIKNVTYKLTEDDIKNLNNNSLKNEAIAEISSTHSDVKDDVTVDTEDISLIKTGVKDVIGSMLAEGNKINYTFTVQNTGSIKLNNVTINDTKLGYVDNIGSLEPGEKVIRLYTYIVKTSDLPGSIFNTATVTSDEGAKASSTNRVGDSDIKVIKNIIKGHDQTDYIKTNYADILNQHLIKVYKGDPVTYIFSAINTGDTYLNDIRLDDTPLMTTQSAMTVIPELSSASDFNSAVNLSTGQKMVFYYESTADDDFVNNVNATGTPTAEDGSIIPNLDKPTSSDSAEIKILSKIGDTVWLDSNKDGIMDNGEAGIPNVPVLLKDASGNVINFTSTDVNGRYVFEGIENGQYTVVVTRPAGMDETYDLDKTLDDETAVNISNGISVMDADFGYIHTGALQGTVWYDLNEDGVKDTDEIRIKDVTVLLKDAGGNTIGQTTTNATGDYYFNNLPGGQYTVEVKQDTLPKGVYNVYDLDRMTTPDSEWVRDNKTVLTLSPGENKNQIDFGYQYTASIGDTVWYDLNGNGIKDSGENGVQGIKLELFKDDEKLDEKVTDASGYYIFDGLERGSYTVKVYTSPILDGYAETYDADGTLDNQIQVNIIPGQKMDTADFGYIPIPHLTIKKTVSKGAANIGDKLNYTVTLLNDGKTILTNVILKDDMLDIHETIPSIGIGETKIFTKDYIVKSSDYPGPLLNVAKAKSNETPEVEDKVTTEVYPPGVIIPVIPHFTLNKTADKAVAKVGDTINYTITIKNDGNTFLSNVKLNDDMLGIDETIQMLAIGETKTYNGSYLVKNSDLPGPLVNKAEAQSAEGLHMNSSVTTEILTSNNSASIGDFVWKDSNKNGIQDSGEIGLRGVNVNLYNGKNELVAAARTDSNGFYKFTNLVEGTYYVKFLVPEGYNISPKNAGNDSEKDSNADQSGRCDSILLKPGVSNMSFDIGIYKADSNNENINPNNPNSPNSPNEPEEIYDDNGNLIGGAPGQVPSGGGKTGQTSPGKGTPDGKTSDKKNSGMPKTATNNYNSILIGILMLGVSAAVWIYDKIKRRDGYKK